MNPALPDDNAATFWERHYRKMTQPSNGRPSAILVRFATGRTPGRSLDLGCGRGDDVVWLARQGWSATGTDVSGTALQAARTSADAAGVTDRVRFERHDLGETFPQGTFDLITALFLHSPVSFDRAQVLRHAASAVAPGGLLLVAAHGSRPPWSWADPETVYPTAEEELAALQLDAQDWRNVFVGPVTRDATGPNGQRAEVVDIVIAIERR